MLTLASRVKRLWTICGVVLRSRLMPDFQPPVSVDLPCPGWRAVRYLPRRDAHGELMLDASRLAFVDAWVASVMRTLVEYRARAMQTRVVIVPPRIKTPRALLIDALGELPSHATWARVRDEEVSTEPLPLFTGTLFERPLADRIVLPAQRISDGATSRDIGRLLPRLGRLTRKPDEMTFLITAFRELVENALIHGDASPVGAIATVVCEPRERSLELVVVDLGAGVQGNEMPEFMSGLRDTSPTDLAGIPSLVEAARLRELPATFFIVTSGRVLRNVNGMWTCHRAGVLPGFAVGVKVRW